MSRKKTEKSSVAAQARQNAIVDHIRKMILSGQLAPGARLIQDDLAQQFGISRTPIREALSRLAQEGFVNISSYKGASVATLSVNHLVDTYTIRIALESYATYLATMNCNERIISSIQEHMEEMGRAFQSNDFDCLVKAHNEFHLAIYAVAQRQHLYDLIYRYISLSDVYQRMSLSMGRGAKDPIKEHLDILQSLRFGEGDAASSLIRTHLTMTLLELQKILEEQK